MVGRVSVHQPCTKVTTMIYAKELVHLRGTNFKHPRGLQIFSRKNDAVERMLRNSRLCANSLHGVQYIWESKLRTFVRLFWLLVLLVAIGAFVAMYTVLTDRHHKQVLTTVVETAQFPIYSINFPSVAVCPWNHVNWFRYKAAEEKFLPSNADKNVKKLFTELVSIMDAITFTKLDPIEVFMNRTLPLVIENIVLYELAQFIAFRCDELFVSCMFDETEQDCCKIFVTERTERGICLVFNSLVSEESRIKKLTDNFYPWKMRSSGEGTGLIFTLRDNKNFHMENDKLPFAFSLLIKESDEWSDPIYHIVLPNTHNFFSITPVITETSCNTRSMDPRRRRCLFTDENFKKYKRIEGLPFNKLNCLVQCQQQFVITHCNCTLSMFFPQNDNRRTGDCKVADLPCLYNHRDVYNYIKSPNQDKYIDDSRRGMECDCIDNCISMIFLVSPNSGPLPNQNNSVSVVKADIFISRNVMTKYGADLDYSWMELVANFGGILGLCLGASVLSMFEIVYAIVKIIIVWVMAKRNNMRRRRRKVHFITNAKVSQK